MKPRFYTIKADRDVAGETAEGPFTYAEAYGRQVADPLLKIVTADQLEIIRRRPQAKEAAKTD